MPPYPPPDPTVLELGSGGPISTIATSGAQPDSVSDEIQLLICAVSSPGKPRRGHECPTRGSPSSDSLPALAVQSRHV